MVTGLIGGVFLLPSGLIASRRWGKRLRSVRETASDVYVGGHGNALSIMFLTGPFVVAAKPQLHHGHPRNEPM